MLPVVDPKASLQPVYLQFLAALKKRGFHGDIEASYASRLAVSTDNSVYQSLPQAVVLPRQIEDLVLLGKLAHQPEFIDVTFSARGGGTGTNGQSLTQGIVVDVSRHMNQILEFNQQERWVRVQAGVVKDQLNDFLRPFGFFFSPDLSTSNRATIGGMISTDASGQGSLVYGKTSDHVLGLTTVTATGEVLQTAPVAIADNPHHKPGMAGQIYQQMMASCVEKRDEVLARFPRLNRFLTGYDLEHGVNDDLTELDISRIITGSEGSLVFVAEAKLNVTPIATHKALVNIKYDSFESALRHAPHMVAAKATSVETVDSKVLNLARQDIVWHSVSPLIEDVPGKDMQGLNMVEYNSEDEGDFTQLLDRLVAQLDKDIAAGRNGVIGYQYTTDTTDITKIYGMRKKAVGLLGKASGPQKPIPFAEDTAVPPENLADFILEFRALLDSHGLQYGMFGHVDAGVLHVRPALDMCDPAQEKLMHQISDQVVELVAKYGGLMWGEHGKGYRSEYSPAFFGDSLYAELQKIKAVFDPHNKMNPGKICTPYQSDAELVKVSSPTRGAKDRQIPVQVRDSFSAAMSCNGNGLCFNYDTTSPMCPSSKITADRRHSPKGRAGMMREWLRLLSQQQVDVAALEGQEKGQSLWRRWQNSRQLNARPEQDFSAEVLEVMEGCLACKACASQCPINVDVPSFRSRFLAMYYKRYTRPLKDLMVANIEKMAPLMSRAPKLVNGLLSWPLVRAVLRKQVGYVDTPLLSVPTLKQRVKGHHQFDLAALQAMTPTQRQNVVLWVQDPFTSYYEADVVADSMALIEKLGYQVQLLPFKPNGKPQHVKGFLNEFANTARDSADFLNQLSQLGCPLVGIDPSMVLCYRDEYNKVLGDARGQFNVMVIHEWLAGLTHQATELAATAEPVYLLSHCTEKTALPSSPKQWQQIFAGFGVPLEIIETGCCGMAGTYGHESSNLANSKGLYQLSWQQQVAKIPPQQLLVTGYSCRSQVKRMDGFKPQHPLQKLLTLLNEN